MLSNGTWECGTKNSAIWFKSNGSVSLFRGSRSLEADWRSLAGRLDVIDKSIQHGARLDPAVNDLLWLHQGHSHVPEIFKFLREIMSANDDEAKQKLSKFSRKIRAARALLKNSAGLYQSFFRELKKLARKLHRPPSKRELAKALGLENNAPQISKFCHETGFDWLPTEKPGPKSSKKPGNLLP